MPPKLCLNVASTVDLPACVSTNGILYLSEISINSSRAPEYFAPPPTSMIGFARDELIEISDKYNIPLVETQAGKSTVEATFKHNLGGMGITGTLAANKVAYAGLIKIKRSLRRSRKICITCTNTND